MTHILSLTAAPINVYSKDFWTSYIAAVNEEAACELGLHKQINPEAVKQATKPGWKASLFTPNILKYADVYFDNSTKLDLSSHTTHVHHHHHAAPAPTKPLSEAEQKEKKKEEEEDSLQKYKWLGPIITGIGAALSAYTWRGYTRALATHDYTAQVRKELSSSKLSPEATPVKNMLECIVTLKLNVDQIRGKIIYRYFSAFALLAVGGGLLTLAAYTKQTRLVPWGQVALAISGIWAAICVAFEWHDVQDIRAIYKRIVSTPERAGDHALYHLFTYYQDNMTLRPTYFQNPQQFQYIPVGQPNGYQPYFSDFAPANPPAVADGYEKDCSGLYQSHSSQYAYAAPSAPPVGV